MGGEYLCSFMSVHGKHITCLLNKRSHFTPSQWWGLELLPSHTGSLVAQAFPFSISSVPFILKLMLSWLVWKMWSRYKELEKESPHSWNCLPVGEHNALSRFLRVTQSWLISAIRPRRVFDPSLFSRFQGSPSVSGPGSLLCEVWEPKGVGWLVALISFNRAYTISTPQASSSLSRDLALNLQASPGRCPMDLFSLQPGPGHLSSCPWLSRCCSMSLCIPIPMLISVCHLLQTFQEVTLPNTQLYIYFLSRCVHWVSRASLDWE